MPCRSTDRVGLNDLLLVRLPLLPSRRDAVGGHVRKHHGRCVRVCSKVTACPPPHSADAGAMVSRRIGSRRHRIQVTRSRRCEYEQIPGTSLPHGGAFAPRFAAGMARPRVRGGRPTGAQGRVVATGEAAPAGCTSRGACRRRMDSRQPDAQAVVDVLGALKLASAERASWRAARQEPACGRRPSASYHVLGP